MGFEMTIAEWLGTAVMLAIPYLVVGMVWTAFDTGHADADGAGRVVEIAGSILNWPALVFSTVCAA